MGLVKKGCEMESLRIRKMMEAFLFQRRGGYVKDNDDVPDQGFMRTPPVKLSYRRNTRKGKQAMNMRILICSVLSFVVLPGVQLNAQWIQVSGSYGGNVQCLIASGTGLFAGTPNGVFHSTNGGQSWASTNLRLTSSVTSFALIGTNLFAGTKYGGVFLSTNDGGNWNAMNNGLANDSVLALAASGTNLFAGTKGGVFCSTNNGVTWTGMTNTLTKGLAVKINGTKDTSLFAIVADTAVMLSTDHGTNWKEVFKGGLVFVPPHTIRVDNIFSLASNDSSVFIGTASEVYRSTDNGLSWNVPSAIPFSVYSQGTSLAANNQDVFESDGFDVYHSTDNGASWNAVSTGLPRNSYTTPDIYSLTLNGSTLFAGTVAGAFSSTNNGRSWINLNNGMNASSVRSIVVNGSSIFASAGNGYHIIHSTDNGSSWTALNDTVYYHFRCLAAKDSCVVAGTDGPAMVAAQSPALISTNKGASWKTLENAPGALTNQSFGINDAYIFAGTTYGIGGILRCSVDSSAWSTIYVGPPAWGELPVRSIFVNGSDIFVGTDRIGIYHSPDNGATWSPINKGLDTSTSSFFVLVADSSNIFTSTSTMNGYPFVDRGMFHSSDNGATWNTANKGLTDSTITALAVHGLKVFAATDSGGVFLSTDNGGRWTSFDEGLPNPYISSLALNDSYVYAGILGGIWRRPLSEAVVSVTISSDNSLSDFSLRQNYPNPFNPSTKIQYQIPTASKVTIKIYNLLGQNIATLVNEQKMAGSYSVEWNASNVPSGVYFYQTEAISVSDPNKRFVDVKKMILLK
jgi:photosystem II stability/assembly factor-like uncharacterized protein